MAEIERLTGNPAFGAFSFTVEPVVHLKGTLGGQPVTTSYEPGIGFVVQSGQLQPSGPAPTGNTSSTGPSSPQAPNYAPTRPGSLGTPGTAPNTVAILGVSPQISFIRWMSLLGLLLSIGATVFFCLRKRGEPFEETVRIQAKYGHLIVPIVAGEDLGWPPVDVPNIKALVRLAEAGQRLILHNRSNDVDTYMVNDEGTVYRYQVKPSKVVWGEWSDQATPVKAAA
jgi:hypothetical protein